ncbi:MAG TPA: exodeoxyribonuclease V subunit gamma, partial [Polyangiales bacterium]
MSLLLHRSHRAETLAELLCGVLSARWPDDPFERVPIVVGSRGMERYLRHEIATRTGIAAGLAFPFPRPAFAGATRWLIDGAVEARAEFWELGEQPHKAAARFEREAMAFRLVEQLRQHMAEPGFEHVRRYLEHGAPQAVDHGPVTARELMFARDVADVLDRLMHDRPDDALTWARAPEKANSEHRWLAVLLQGLDVAQDAASPARGFEALRASTLAPTQRTLCVFGLSTLGPGDRARLAAIARSVDVHLFVLAPTRQWFVDQRTRDERRHAVRNAKNAGQLELLELEEHQDNPIVAALGAPSRDLQSWLEETGYAADDDAFEL